MDKAAFSPMNQVMKIDVLAIGAHPDDVELHAGGTLLRLASLGYSTAIVDLTRGEAGTRGSAAQRAAEAQAAAMVLGVAFRDVLDLGDSRLLDSEANRAAVVTLLRRFRPRLVLTHYIDQPHPDHAAVAAIVTAATYLAGLRLACPGDGLTPHRPSAVLHFGLPRGTAPSFVVDVSNSEEQWERAVRCHRSQWHDPHSDEPDTAVSQPDFLARVIARRRGDGAAIGALAGEAFWVRNCIPVSDPVALFARPYDVLP
jgi:bacillithiol biosynthesis deacetylase BshB1